MTTLALIGKGDWGSNYLQEVKKIHNCEIKYIRTTDYKDLLQLKDIDGIIIATPDNTHAEIIKVFPDTYLLVEKPFTTSLKDALVIHNNKIMVGYTYLYNRLLMKSVGELKCIKYINFKLCNLEQVNGLDPLWYLASHGIALCLYLLGDTKTVYAYQKNGNQIIELHYPQAICRLESGWNYKKRERFINVVGDTAVYFHGYEIQPVTPLESQLRAFVDFIHGKKVITELEFAKKVTLMIDSVEHLLKSTI